MEYFLATQDTIRSVPNDFVVVIDVIRAFTTACYAYSRQPKVIYPVAEISDAKAWKRKDRSVILVGERFGVSIPGFDYNNSPSQMSIADLRGKTIVMTTTAGTRGLHNAPASARVVTGSFVNSGAITSYIQKEKPAQVTFLCTDDRYYDSEDFLCASFIKSRLEGKPLSFPAIRAHIRRHPATKMFLEAPLIPTSRKDFALCMETDVFPFVLKRVTQNGHMALVRHDIR
jgi:2-phosphosulfolactate phosphatase